MLSFIVKRVAAAPLALAFALSSTPAVSAPHAEDNYSTGRFLASFEIENCTQDSKVLRTKFLLIPSAPDMLEIAPQYRESILQDISVKLLKILDDKISEVDIEQVVDQSLKDFPEENPKFVVSAHLKKIIKDGNLRELKAYAEEKHGLSILTDLYWSVLMDGHNKNGQPVVLECGANFNSSVQNFRPAFMKPTEPAEPIAPPPLPPGMIAI